MSKLTELYQSIETLKKLGVKINKEQLKALDDFEEDLIKNEVLPALSQDIAPRLNPIKRDLVLVVEYHPGDPISVALSRKVKISDFSDAKRLNLDASKPQKKAPAIVKQEVADDEETEILRLLETKDFYVTFADGTRCVGRDASDTMVKAINQMLKFTTIEKLSAIGITVDARPMISIRPYVEGRTSYHQLSNGWWANTHMNNQSKKDKIERLAKHCGIKLTVHLTMKKKRESLKADDTTT